MKPEQKLKQIRDRINKQLADGKQFDFLKDDIPELIERRTRLGKGVDYSGNLVKLNPLSEKYVERRKRISISSETTPKRSNLTLTGLMLSSIKGFRKGTLFTFYVMGLRKSGKKTVRNTDIAMWQEEKGRRFFDLSSSERLGLSRKISKIISTNIKKLFDN